MQLCSSVNVAVDSCFGIGAENFYKHDIKVRGIRERAGRQEEGFTFSTVSNNTNV